MYRVASINSSCKWVSHSIKVALFSTSVVPYFAMPTSDLCLYLAITSSTILSIDCLPHGHVLEHHVSRICIALLVDVALNCPSVLAVV